MNSSGRRMYEWNNVKVTGLKAASFVPDEGPRGLNPYKNFDTILKKTTIERIRTFNAKDDGRANDGIDGSEN